MPLIASKPAAATLVAQEPMAEAQQDREEGATRALLSLRGRERSLARAPERSKGGGTACAVAVQATLLGTTTMATSWLLLLCLVVAACGAAGFSAQHWARR